ncbi:MAG: c-type cytochrome [Campylobacteraceae bacterium]|jgi:cytochrome c553|nr:c-type cytochrome [Campylobacteraceae bacterium]
MSKRVIFLIVLFLCSVSLAEEEITIKATGDFAKELKELVEKYQENNISGSIEVVEDSESEEEQLKKSPLEQAMQEEIKKDGSTNASLETYEKYFSDEKQDNKGIFGFIFSSNEQTNVSKGKASYEKKCISCHGENAQKSSYLNARNLITLAKDEIVEEVKNYRRDSGYSKGTGFIMRSQAVMVNDKEVRDIADYIDSLKNKNTQP